MSSALAPLKRLDSLEPDLPRGATAERASVVAPGGAAPVVEIVIPVHNEERDVCASTRKLHWYMRRHFRFPFRITIADNASTDRTLERARELERELAPVRVLSLELKGRGRALRAAWSHSDAEVLAYMDVDLSTDLGALPGLIEPLLARRADVVIGSRLIPGAEVERGLKRELISRSYNVLLHAALRTSFADAQCGFKAARREVLLPLLERVEDDSWFFDTELLYHAQRAKLLIREIPVRWADDPDSRVKILSTAREDLRGILRLRRLARDGEARPELKPARPSQPLPGVAPPLSLQLAARPSQESA